MAEEDARPIEPAPPEGGVAATSVPTASSSAAPGPDLPYQALYRRYRPQRFDDVKGQQHVSRALRNAVRENRVVHAYLFSGPRGTGKTSTARILAMALNCQAPNDGEPDGTCTSCLSIRGGASMDVFELDAASNRKLDEMRDLLSRVALGTPGRWKVYIIDEVHQLTADAASALLKTLEEPPSHVVFVLATTDPQKVLPTILSRAQHFEFRPLDGDVLTELLTGINEHAGLALSPAAVRLAAQRGRGSARDAESALEQLAASGGAEDEGTQVPELAEALADRDISKTLEAVAKAINAGREPRRLGSDLLEYLRNAFLAHQAPSLVLLPEGTLSRLTDNARQMGLPLLVRAMETVGEALVDMRDSVDPRVTLEVALIRLASPAVDTSPGAVLERLERLERALAERAGAPPSPPGPVGPSRSGEGQAPPGPSSWAPSAPVVIEEAQMSPQRPSSPGATQAKVALGAYLRPAGLAAGPPPQSAVAAPRAVTSTMTPELPSRDELTKAWGDTVLNQLSRPAKVYMAGGRFIEIANGAAVFGLPGEGLLARAANFQAEAETALEAHFGRTVPLRLVLDKHPGSRPGYETGPGPSEPSPEAEETYDLDEIGDIVASPSVPTISVEQRILQAFPGSVLDG